jgi:hypothetical protein
MAAKSIVAERQSIALGKVREHAAALGESLGVDTSALGEYVKGDAAYQEMVRTEQLADLLAALRDKVAPQVETVQEPEETGSVPQDEPQEPAPAKKVKAKPAK